MQYRTLRKIALSVAIMIVAIGSLTLLGCGSDDEEARNVNTSVALNATTGASLNGVTASVPGAVLAANASTPALATALTGQTTSIAFSGISGANGNVALTNPTATGTVRFASCTFTITAPANLAGTITIQNCNLTVTGTAVPVGGSTVSGGAVLVLNGVSSGSVTVLITLDANGMLTVNGVATAVTVTGTSGG